MTFFTTSTSFDTQPTATTTTINLLDPGDLYTEGYSIVDLKLAKVLRLRNRRLNIGVDIDNLISESWCSPPTYHG